MFWVGFAVLVLFIIPLWETLGTPMPPPKEESQEKRIEKYYLD